MHRIVRYNASEARELYRWKIQWKARGKWVDYRVNGAVKMFMNQWHAENYLKLIRR
jgi:hypothetical protein